MKIEDLELVEGSCLDCVFRKINCNFSDIMKENGIVGIELDDQIGNCCSDFGSKCYKLKQKEA